MVSIHVALISIEKTYKVVAEQLHDEGAVLVALLAQSIELCNFTLWLAQSICQIVYPKLSTHQQ